MKSLLTLFARKGNHCHLPIPSLQRRGQRGGKKVGEVGFSWFWGGIHYLKATYLIQNIKYFFTLTLCLLFLECLSGCSFHIPKIIVLDDPLSPEEHLNLGVAYENKGEYENAIREYTHASKSHPVAYLYIGNVYFLKNELREAEKYYKKALQKDPGNADAHNNLAWLYYTKGENLSEAESLVLKALELDPSKRDTYQDTLEKIRDARVN